MAYPVYRMLMAARILRDPLFVRARFVSAASRHGDLMIHGSHTKMAARCQVERPSGAVLASLVLVGCSTLAYRLSSAFVRYGPAAGKDSQIRRLLSLARPDSRARRILK